MNKTQLFLSELNELLSKHEADISSDGYDQLEIVVGEEEKVHLKNNEKGELVIDVCWSPHQHNDE